MKQAVLVEACIANKNAGLLEYVPERDTTVWGLFGQYLSVARFRGYYAKYRIIGLAMSDYSL